ncbi:hypothetical protein BDW02DRAFT_512669 [Decorospora gaudefroyi]|uniref:Uncharacterized protein n=1 Tax=Decorospora gaudefroyi TaxID=184978 RepID=A0A6A5K265_9PLEO|nr:hypothetical protein BDW02DRAFT_512669 [Decorospora gaudefroyi]
MDFPPLPYAPYGSFAPSLHPCAKQAAPGTLSQHVDSATTKTEISDNTPEPGGQDERSENRGHGFGAPAPSMYLLFPASANITAVELLTFLPNTVHCANVVYRLMTNGGSPHAVWTIINTQRDLSVEWSQSTSRTTLYKAMRKAGYKDWVLRIHDKFHEERKDTWDEADMDVAGFLTPGQIGKRQMPAADVPFKSLAVDVRRMPQGDDALDLTRMVQYCVENPSEPWMYPQDYDALLGVLGGATVIRMEHIDREAFKRWAGVKPPPPGKGTPNALLAAGQRDTRKKRKRESSIKRSTPAPRKRKLSRTASAASDATSMSDTPIQETEKPRRSRGRPKKNEMEEITDMNDYTRTATYVAPPGNTPITCAEIIQLSHSGGEAMNRAFLKEGDIGEVDPYTAYAFGGPRHTPPFRYLYRIEQPDPADNSGWAENLRWAFEQNTLFRFPHRPDAWNESPKHMERIVKIRREQYWMSDEFLEQTEAEQDVAGRA